MRGWGEQGREPLRYWKIPLTPDHAWRGILKSFWPDCQRSIPQQFLCVLVHAGKLLGDGVLQPVLLLRQPLDPPDLGQELADLLGDVPAILLSHG